MAIQKPPFGSDAAKRAIVSSKTFGMTPPLVAGSFVEQRVSSPQCVGEAAGEVGVETVQLCRVIASQAFRPPPRGRYGHPGNRGRVTCWKLGRKGSMWRRGSRPSFFRQTARRGG